MNSDRLRRRQAFAVLVALASAVASSTYAVYGGATPIDLVGPLLVSALFIVTGLMAWDRRPDNPLGALMLTLGVCLLLIAFVGPPVLALYPLGLAAFLAANALLGYVVLAFPTGRLSSPWAWALVVATVVLTGVPRIVRLTLADPAAFGSDLVNPYLLIRDQQLASGIALVPYAADVVVLACYLVAVPLRWWHASPPARRILLPMLGPSFVLLATLMLDALAIVAQAPANVTGFLDTAQLAVRALIPIGFLIGIMRTRIARSAVSDLVVELGQTPTPARLRDALANALGDPSLTVAYWSLTAGGFVDATGSPTELPADGSGRAVTLLERDGRPLAAIIHDPALLDDPGLVPSVASALRLAVENERLATEVEAQLAEVRASRARIVEAGDAERRRVERNLHDGAQQRLTSMALALRLARTQLGDDLDPAARESLDQAAAEARAALSELRELARGIHPLILTEAGLGPAVESLASRSPIDVSVDIDDRRFAPAVEEAAYFVVSEALANVGKYAEASHASVQSTVAANSLTLEIADDGIGGADPTAGSGLRGLADRLAAIDGTLKVISPRGGGTRLVAWIPVATSPEVPG